MRDEDRQLSVAEARVESGKDIQAYQGQRQSFFRNFQTSNKEPEQEKQGKLNGGGLEKVIYPRLLPVSCLYRSQQRLFPAVYLASTFTLDTSSFNSTQKVSPPRHRLNAALVFMSPAPSTCFLFALPLTLRSVQMRARSLGASLLLTSRS